MLYDLPDLLPKPRQTNFQGYEKEAPHNWMNTTGTAAYEKYEGKTQPTHFALTKWDLNEAVSKAISRGDLQKDSFVTLPVFQMQPF